jgi:hypothetical protein
VRLRVAVACAVALALAPAALAAAPPTGPVYDGKGHLIGTPFAPPQAKPRLTRDRALAIFEAYPKVRTWLAHYPRKSRVTDVTYQGDATKCTGGTAGGCWNAKIWSGKAGEVATGRVDDRDARVTEAWTGPQVAWKMARGYKGAFGGAKINSYLVWLAFSAIFLLGLLDWRRLLSVRTLDLLVLLSFSVSLWFFNRGDVFTSVPLAYPPMLYLLGRCLWIGFRGRASPTRAVWPAWLLLAATVFLLGFKVGLNVEASNVIDVGFAGVIGAERIYGEGRSPYGNFPTEGNLKPCGPADAEGEIRNRIQSNGRCESANDRGDTYGPVAYEAYGPGYAAVGWSGKWDDLPAAHFTSILFDVLCVIGAGLAGLRLGGRELGAAAAFAWAAYPFTQYASNSNTNDALPPAFLLFGFALLAVPWGRGIFAALSGWTKFVSLVVAPLWLTYPEIRFGRRQLAFLAGFALATAAAFSVLLLEPSPAHAARVFYDRTIAWQFDRQSPFSIWDWRQYHAGLPDLHVVRRVLQALLVAAALGFAVVPRRKSPLQLAALTAVLLIGFELVLTHWFYLYIPWFFPFVALAVLAPAVRRAAPAPLEPDDGREVREPALVR